MTTRSLVVVSAGLRQPSSTRLLADQLAEAAREATQRRDLPSDVELIELRDHAHDVVNHLLTGFPSQTLKRILDTVAGADGLVAVTPIFNASYGGLFKSFFDLIGDYVLEDKPVLVAATGGTARHSLALEHALRPMFTYLRAVVVPTSVFAAAEDWAGAAADNALRARIERAADELAELMSVREKATMADPFALTTSFEELLSDSSHPPGG